MEAVWNLEDKFKLSTQEAFLLFAGVAFAVIGLCAATVAKKMTRKKQTVGPGPDDNADLASCGWVSIKRVLVGSVRWSGARKWEGGSPPAPAQLIGCGEVGWKSQNSASPVWQRPILMGEKCELPRFSGLILYDERGRLLSDFHKHTSHEEKSAAVRTTLKDLL